MQYQPRKSKKDDMLLLKIYARNNSSSAFIWESEKIWINRNPIEQINEILLKIDK